MRHVKDDSTLRKRYPLARGLLDYFPEACAEVAHVSYLGNEQHNPGQEMHWDREKSMDQADCIVRHLMARGTLDNDGIRHTAKAAWRMLAMLQIELEAAAGLSISRGSTQGAQRKECIYPHCDCALSSYDDYTGDSDESTEMECPLTGERLRP